MVFLELVVVAVEVMEEVAADPTLLLFEYTVVTGDDAGDLDYWSDEEVSFFLFFSSFLLV